jgi:hypothetical protein
VRLGNYEDGLVYFYLEFSYDRAKHQTRRVQDEGESTFGLVDRKRTLKYASVKVIGRYSQIVEALQCEEEVELFQSLWFRKEVVPFDRELFKAERNGILKRKASA